MAVGSYLNGSTKIWEPLAELWNGSTWTVQKPPNPTGSLAGNLAKVSCTAESACTAVGSFQKKGAITQTLKEEWNGSSWSIVASVNPPVGSGQLTGISCVVIGTARPCVASGYATVPEKPVSLFVENSGTYETPPLAAGTTSSALERISCMPTALNYVCMAVGWATVTGEGSIRSLAEYWNGEWVQEFVPRPSGSTNSALTAVSCAKTTTCKAAGENAAGSQLLVEGWEGVKWSIETSPSPSGESISSAGVSCTINTCDIVGVYLTKGERKPLVVRRELSKWSLETPPVPAGSSGVSLWDVSCPGETWCMAVGGYAFGSEERTLAELFS